MQEKRVEPISFDAFEVDLAAHELSKRGVRLKLQEQPFQVLAALLEKPGEVVTREELKDRIWGDDTYVDFDKSLSAAVNKVRQALDDSRTRPRFIETVPKVGYRFIHPLDGALEAGNRPTDGGVSRARWAGIAAVLAAAALLGWLYLPDSDLRTTTGPLNVVPLTSYEGREDFPTFSPDGSQVAFTWRSQSDENPAVYVKSVGSEQARKVTDHATAVSHPAWSPDGRSIAYILNEPESCELRVISPVGGASRMLTTLDCPWTGLNFSHLAWSFDGRFLAYPDKPRSDAPWALFAVEQATRETRRLTHPPAGIFGDDGPSFAWQDNHLAFIRRRSAFNASELRIVEFDADLTPTGNSRSVSVVRPKPFQGASSVIWTSDGVDLLFADPTGLWRISSRGGEASRLFAPGGWRINDVTLSRSGHRLAFVRHRRDADIWQLDRRSGLTRPLLTSTRVDWFHSISPGGGRITWTSSRSGFSEIWVCNADGSEPLQLTALETQSGAPVWSPDGKTIAFDTRVNGNGDVYLIDSAGGVPRRLTQDPSDDLMPSWSADGSAVYFESQRDGETAIWNINVESGKARRVSDGPGGEPKASPDGKFLFFRGDRDGWGRRLKRKRLADGEESFFLEDAWGFEPIAGGIYYSSWESGTIHYFDFESGNVEELLAPERPATNIAVSPDEQTILFVQREPPQADVMLVEGFE